MTIGLIAERTPWRTTLALGQALGARGADVVLVHRLDQVAAHQPREDRRALEAASTSHGMISEVNHFHGS